MADETRQHLKTLGLLPGASAADLKQAYRELAAIWHPDRYAHAPQMQAEAQVRMAEINQAYHYLKTHGTGDGRVTGASSASTPASSKASAPAPGPASRPRPASPPPARSAAPPPAPDVPLLRAVHILRVTFAASQPVSGVALSPDGGLILAAMGSHAVWWDAQSGQQAQGIAAGKGSVSAIAVASNGRHLAFANNMTGWMGGARCEVRICDLKTGHERHRVKVSAHISSLEFSPDGKQFAAGDANGTVHIWEADSGRGVQTLPGSDDAGGIRRAAYVDGGQAAKQIVTLKTGKTLSEIALWEVRRARLLKEYTLHVREVMRYGEVADIAPSPDGRLLLVANNDRANRSYTLHLWDMQTGEETSLAASDKKEDGTAGNADGDTPKPAIMRGHTDDITRVAWAWDGLSIVSGSEDKTVRVWDARTGKESGRGVGHTRSVRAVAFAPDGSFLVSGGDDGTARVWQPQP